MTPIITEQPLVDATWDIPDEMSDMIMSNPIYCTTIDARLFGQQRYACPLSRKEFIDGALCIINTKGAIYFLNCLLENLYGNFITNEDVPNDARSKTYQTLPEDADLPFGFTHKAPPKPKGRPRKEYLWVDTKKEEDEYNDEKEEV